MSDVELQADTRDIVVDEMLPHAPETIWRALTSGELIARWLMAPSGFAPVKGNRFTYKTTPAGEWDGVIHCEVLEVIPNQRFVYAWTGGHAGNVGYGAPLRTVVTFILTEVPDGTRLRLIHSGFVLPRNETAFTNMGAGWKKCFPNIGVIAAEQRAPKKPH
jgi:uncharacterized protein YndB with AHSA1/START domain